MLRIRDATAILLFALLPLGCGDSPTGGDETPPEPDLELPDLTWLEANAIPFQTAEPGGDHSDLEFLRQVVGDARVVSLGEGTHGSREFFQMKHRILEFLVEEMDFNLFGIEATWAESNHVDDFVRTGEGDPAVLLSDLYFWTWNTQEVMDMILWMREHNLASGDAPEVGFGGFDLQHSAQAMQDVIHYAIAVGAHLTWYPAQQYSCWNIWEHTSAYVTNAPEATKAECRRGVWAAYNHLAERREQYEAASSPAEYARALQAARVVVQHEHLRSVREPGDRFAVRDGYMAENAAWLLEQGGLDAKIVLWAHNGHVNDRAPAMGRSLRERFGDDMVVVGFSFGQGGLNAVRSRAGQVTGPLGSHFAPPAPSGSYEHAFQGLGLPRFAVDLRPLRNDPPQPAAWLLGPRPFRSIGATYDPDRAGEFFQASSLPAEYDVVIHFDETAPSRLLPFVN